MQRFPLINVGDDNYDQNVCLLRNVDQELVLTYPDLEFNEVSSKEITDKVTDAICQEPTPMPTNGPIEYISTCL